MTINIAVVGPPGSGKTTLIRKLEKELHRRGKSVMRVDEVARSSPFDINEGATFHSQRWIFLTQILKELEVDTKKADVILYDRCMLDNLCFIDYLIQENKSFPMIEYLQIVEITRYWISKYDYIISMPFNKKYLIDDKVRSTNIAFATSIEKLIKKTLQNFNVNVIRYRKNFNVNTFCDRFSQRKRVRVINRKRR